MCKCVCEVFRLSLCDLFISIRQVKGEYIEFLTALGIEGDWASIDPQNIVNSSKAVVTIFSVVQSTARKLSEKETRKQAVNTMFDHARKSPYWDQVSAVLINDIDEFVKGLDDL